MEPSQTEMPLPQGGRIGRFAKLVQQEVEPDAIEVVLKDADRYKSLPPAAKAGWWRSAVERLEDELGTKGAIQVMRGCGRKCCGPGHRATARRLMSESDSLQDFLEKASSYGVKEGEIEYRLVDDATILGLFHRCFCGQVKNTEGAFANLTYCHCSAEFHRRFFEAALEQPVEVAITQSIIGGADHCEFVIQLAT